MTSLKSDDAAPAGSGWKLPVLLAFAAIYVVLILRHTHGLNGANYHPWYWRNLGIWPLYGLTALAAIPFFLGQWIEHRFRKTTIALLLLMAATFAFELAAISQQPGGLHRIGAIVENAINTSYYSVAKEFVADQNQGAAVRDWMSIFPDLMPKMMMHARYKPPGLILYYMAVIEVLGTGVTGQMAGGLFVGLGATLAIPATYLLIRRLGHDSRAAWCGASFMSLCPALLLFFPQFDQIYPVITCAMAILWCVSLEQGKPWLAVAFGGVLALATFMSYTLLVLGVFLAVYTILYCGRMRWPGVARAIQFGLLSLAVVWLFYVVLWICWWFDPIQTLRTANSLQEAALVDLNRPFPGYVPWDIADFALGSGWISYLLVAFLLAGTVWRLALPARRLIGLSLLQIAIMAAAALLPGEAARLWMPLYPFLMVPIGFELARWSFRERIAVYVSLWLITTVVAQNMLFLNMGEGHR